MLGNRLGGGLGLGGRGDDGVRDTNDDAQLSKLSCVRHGYFQDNFVHNFVRRPARRSPLINRGYYSRYAALRSLMLQFLALTSTAAPPQHAQQDDGAAALEQPQPSTQAAAASREDGTTACPQGQPPPPTQQQQQQQQQQQESGPCTGRRRQILVLGAGFDTAFFQMAAEGVGASKYIELDFLQVTQKKAAAIQRVPELRACLGDADDASIQPEEGRVVTERYCLLPADLRDTAQLAAALEAAGLDPEAPTLVLSECVLVYLQPQHSREVVRWLAERLRCAAMVVYEQIGPHDAFGQQMLINLESRGCALLGIEATPSLEAHRRRFTECGWQRAEAHDMDHVYRPAPATQAAQPVCSLLAARCCFPCLRCSHCIDPVDRRRIERLEIFDEFEEWHLIQQHYCIAIGVKDDSGLLQRFGLPHFPQPSVPGGGAAAARPRPGAPPPRFVT